MSKRKNSKVTRVKPNTIQPIVKPSNTEKRQKPDALTPFQEQKLCQLYSSRWYSVSDLKRIELESGTFYKRGKFSNSEASVINEAVQDYLKQSTKTFDEFKGEFFERRGHGRLSDFFVRAAQLLPGRPVIHVYHFLRRQYHPGNWKGSWSEDEDRTLKQLFALHGPKWELIGSALSRFHVACKDRYRIIRQAFNTGRWSLEEVDLLKHSIAAWKREKPADCAVWGWIADRVKTRSWAQCLAKWTGSLEVQMRRSQNGVHDPLLWTDQQDLILLHKLYDLVVEDESEVIWSKLPDESWNYWTGTCLQRRWALLRRRVYRERYLDMDTILETLICALRPLSPDRVLDEDPVLDATDLEVA